VSQGGDVAGMPRIRRPMSEQDDIGSPPLASGHGRTIDAAAAAHLIGVCRAGPLVSLFYRN